MSRGGRGGRGRGRFGGRGSLTQDLIRDNYEDLGMDSFQIIDDKSPPLLYPPIDLPTPIPLTEEELYCVQKMRELSYRFQTSPYYLSWKLEQNDIVRYSDRYRSNTNNLSLLDCINTSSEDASKYIPYELLEGGATLGGRSSGAVAIGQDDIFSKQKKRKNDLALQKLEQAEAMGAGLTKQTSINQGDEEGSDKEGDQLEEFDEFEFEDDYGVDHEASDDGDDYGDEGEAIF